MKVNYIFTIGQFAKLHGINKKTLMWYDEIGLFKPSIIKDNGYRYYSYQQSHLLETILMYKDLGMSLKEIKDILNENDLDKIKAIGAIKLDELNHKIEHLTDVYNKLKSYNNGIDKLKTIDINDISIVYRQKKYLGLSTFKTGSTYESEIANVINKLKDFHIDHFRDVSFGTMINTDNIYSHAFENYDYLFFELNEYRDDCFVKEEGKYLRAFHLGLWSKIDETYTRMLKFASLNNIKLKGYAYEKGINEAFIDDIKDYITMIEIKIED